MAKRSPAARHGGGRRRALVTGASTGIGAAFAEQLAHEPYDLILVARGRERLEELAQRLRQECEIEVEPLAADLTDPAQLRVVEEVVAGDERLDLLVNNAGFGTFGRFAESDLDQEEREVRLNVVALVRLTRAALPAMIARRQGSIINVSSLAAFQPAPFNATYGATKAYVTSFTEALYEELRGTGVRVQALCPGFTRTEFQKRAGIDPSGIPSFAWMTPQAVVQASLAALRRGDVVVVPGLTNRLLAMATGMVPRSLTRRIAGTMAKSYAE
jgi:short-subunit dehydrogenase